MSKTQSGFRKARSAAHALFVARRLMDISERQGTNLSLILLDWEKAFDKIDHAKLLEVLIEVLCRLQLPNNISRSISNIYKDATFKVVNRDASSSYKRQNFGIRQGCPLSPYLFGIVMSAMFQDIKRKLYTPRQPAPISGIKPRKYYIYIYICICVPVG